MMALPSFETPEPFTQRRFVS